MNEIVVEELVDLVDSEGKTKERGVPRSRAKQKSGELTFVDDFFDDLDLALSAIQNL